MLDDWATILRPDVDQGRRVYAHVNNDIVAQAPVDAVRLRDRLSG